MRAGHLVWIAAIASGITARAADFSFIFDPNQLRWDLSNGVIHAAFQIDPAGRFGLVEIDHLKNGVVWKAPAGQISSPIRLKMGANTYDNSTFFRLLNQHVESPDANTQRQVVILQDVKNSARIQIALEMSADQSVIRYHTSATNLERHRVFADIADLVPFSFSSDAQNFRLLRVTQWSVLPRIIDFQTNQVTLTPDGTPSTFSSGSGGTYCTWMALRDENDRGLFAGWEFDGEAQSSASYSSSSASLALSTTIQSLNHPVDAGATFDLPGAFIGLFQGNWDEAGYRTQRFSEAALAAPAPDGFPYVSWDSWGYETNINEDILRANADIASKLGVELFVVDLGWARGIGDWREDPEKFPSGIRALSDYVHSLGMKFGMHFALAEAMADSPVLQNNPDWTSSESYNYFDALSLCLSNQDTQDWVVNQAVAMIDNYNVDWLLQDGQNMVKKCVKTTHTHDPRDSNYANAVDGIDAVIARIRALRHVHDQRRIGSARGASGSLRRDISILAALRRPVHAGRSVEHRYHAKLHVRRAVAFDESTLRDDGRRGSAGDAGNRNLQKHPPADHVGNGLPRHASAGVGPNRRPTKLRRDQRYRDRDRDARGHRQRLLGYSNPGPSGRQNISRPFPGRPAHPDDDRSAALQRRRPRNSAGFAERGDRLRRTDVNPHSVVRRHSYDGKCSRG